MSEHLLRRANGTSAAHDPPTDPDSSVAELGHDLAALARQLPGPLRSLHVRSGEREIRVEWGEPTALSSGTHAPTSEPTGAEPAEPVLAVRAPLVGTYYAAPAPGSAPFVRPGDLVVKGQTVAIVEAMKMMNPVVAEEAGVVLEVLVTDGASVEFEQALVSFSPQEEA